MAYLLGNESCIESLRNDLSDIQETIDEIVNRNGPIKCYSWKSPDKLAIDLPINEMLDRFKHGTDDVDNQLAHYSLLELIIDRLLLLIYLSGTSIDASLISDSEISRKNSNSKVTHVSAGLAIKKYWNKLTQMMTVVRQLNCQNKALQAKQKEELNKQALSARQQSVKSNLNVKSNSPQKNFISNEISFKSTQTNETSFVPCESCAKVQTNLKQNADQLINMCHYQDIQSQVGKYRATLMSNQLIGGWLSGPELEKWLIEQDRDFSKISKQLEYLTKNNQLLKSKLEENELAITRLQNVEKELRKSLKEEKDSQGITMKQYEKKLVEQKSELDLKIKNLESEIKSLSDLKKSLDQKYENLKNLHDNNEKIIVELNETNRMIAAELDVKTDQKEKLQHTEEELLVARTELECLKRELNEKNKSISVERAKLEDLIRTEQSFKLKHEVLVESIDKLTAENENLKHKYKTTVEEKDSFLELIKSKKELIENLEYDKQVLVKSIEEMKVQMKKLQDNELLLLKYPDLYGPIEQTEELGVAEEMQNQINANSHRIKLLENLNNNLFNSVKKLHETQQNSRANSAINKVDYFMKENSTVESRTREKQVLSRPVPLFKLENEIDESELQNELDYKSQSNKSCWKPEQSYEPQPLITANRFDSDEEDNEDEEDDADNFLKNKHESDQNYLSKLNQISADLKIEPNADFSLIKNRRNISSRENSFMFSPSQSSMNTERNTSSKLSNYSVTNGNRTPKVTRTPIPPADKTMEVVVGKGRRVSSASASARSNLSTANAKNNLPPQTPISRVKSGAAKPNSALSFKCQTCDKKYNNSKDLDIHKMYCS